jgi:hydroxymethylbilane synthase
MAATLRLATRGSPLALWQANHVAGLLRQTAPDLSVELVQIETTGDRVRDKPLSQIGGDGLFTKEIQRAVLDGRADVAVHSLKDLPTLPVDGLILAAVPERGAVGDVLVSRRHASVDALPPGATIATGSLRRRAQLLYHRPDLRVVDLRGNVETRLRKLDEDSLDGIVLAQAGLERVGMAHVITEVLDPQWMLPAVGQGALGLECRTDDSQSISAIAKLNHEPSALGARAERMLLRGLGGGCQVPLGVLTTVAGAILHLRGAVISTDGRQRIAGEAEDTAQEAEAIGWRLANELLAKGARELLAS